MINSRRRMTLRSTTRGPVIAAAILLGVAASVGAPAPAAAQISIPSITAPKQAAQRAVAATNAQTAAMQDVGAPAPTQPGRAAPSAQATHAVATPIKMTTPPLTPKPAPAVAESHPAPATKSPAAPAGAKAPAAAVETKVAATGAKPGAAAPGNTKTASPAPAAATAAGPGSVGDSAGNSISVTQRGTKGEVSLNREVFSYDQGARRDPFISLMRSGDLRPMLSDLKLVTVLYDATGQNSIAILRDQSNKDQYRARVGTTLGRMRVVQIQPKQVVFTIEEVGFSRQEALALGDTTKARTP